MTDMDRIESAALGYEKRRSSTFFPQYESDDAIPKSYQTQIAADSYLHRFALRSILDQQFTSQQHRVLSIQRWFRDLEPRASAIVPFGDGLSLCPSILLEIFYCFLDGTDRQKYKVESVMHEWMWYANIIFVRKPDEDESAAFRITFEGDGSWCFIGKTALNQKTGPTMQFDQISDEEKTVDSERGTILHEFGHALGLLHEHQGPGAARALDWNEDEVLEWYRNRGYDDRFIRNNVLFMFSKRTQPSNYNAFDPRSIMVYRINPEFNSAGLAADLNCNLSDMDKAYMVINYPRPDPHPQASRWTLHHALKVAGVPKRIIREWKDLPPSSIRDKFSAYQEAEREASRLNIKCVETHISQKACFYKIICNANLSEFKRRSQVRRQYSQFEDFRAALADNVKDIPTLPGTGPFWTTWPCYRRKKLREWLCSLPKHPEFERIKSELRRFLQDEFYEIIRRDVE